MPRPAALPQHRNYLVSRANQLPQPLFDIFPQLERLFFLGTVILETTIITIAVLGSSILHPDNAREIIPTTARLGLPSLPGAILLGGVFAKVISTANNFLFSPASNLIHDVYKRFIRPNASERRTLLISRLLVVLLGVFALRENWNQPL